ncbi:uncharacterized protein [Pyxicephalus adspersus]|uniref:THAP-type domain-containing protein n=1 Tax=Pyxicephalus adspersus TaxID=30357 RepID=A0AAV2ZSR8_PYXAD|nr:TPA: hypothetical protein GDO54_004294 [Pyxicephalus adspersus]
MPSCLVPGCTFSWRTRQAETMLHVFPRKWDILQIWLEKIFVADEQMEDLMTKIHSSRKGAYRICSSHFTENDYETRGPNKVLKKNAVPSMNLKPPVELHVDHPYTKRARLDEGMQPVPSASCLQQSESSESPSQQAVPSVSSLQDSEQHPDPSLLSISLTDPEDIATASDSESQNIEYMSVEEYQMEQMVESLSEFVESSTATPEPVTQRQKRKYTPRVRRAVGMVTKHCPTYVHKSTQYDKFAGKKSKIVQAERRKPHMSIGVQCNLANLPSLSRFEGKVGISGADNDQKYINFVLQSTFLPDLPSDTRTTEEIITKSIPRPSTQYQPPNLFVPSKSRMPGNNSLSLNKSITEPKSVTISKQHKKNFRSSKDSQKVLTEDEIYTDPEDPDVSFIPVQDSAEAISYTREKKYLVFSSCLDELLWNCKCKASSTCTGKIQKIKKYLVGSALVVTGVCSKDHKFRMWASQPFVGHMPMGNLFLSGAIVCSGSYFQKMKDFFSLLCMPDISQSTHEKNQQKYIYPTIEHHWENDRNRVLKSLGNKPVALAGDGQCDPSGFNKMSCSYIFMEMDTQKIVDFQVEQLQQGDSPDMLEPNTFRTALDRLLNTKLKVKVIASARNAGIRRILRSDYRNILHKYDLWHLAKSIESKLQAASKEANCAQLSAWVVPAKNHLLWSASTCRQDPQLLKEKWISIACHAANIHQWYSASQYHSCHHSSIRSEEVDTYDWLQAGSAAHHRLKEIVQDKRLLGDLEQLPHYFHTGGLEIFHSLAHKYRSKRHYLPIDDMVAQSQLAILDHNHNISRMQAVVKRLYVYSDIDGVLHYRQSYSNSKKQWTLSKIYDPANRLFLFDIMSDTVALASGEKNFAWQSRRKDTH